MTPTGGSERPYDAAIYSQRKDLRLGSFFRRRRFAFFEGLLRQVPRPLRILDVGGDDWYWKQMGWGGESGVRLTLLNLDPRPTDLPGSRSIVGDATDMPEFPTDHFDIAFSNSVIEHVGGWERQARMAREVMRVGRRYFVQTPNRRFPVEPHFLLPFFQYYPLALRTALVSRFTLGHMRRGADRDDARRIAASVRLLTGRELRRLFPEAQVWRERLLGLTKSFVAYGGWDDPGG